MHIQRGKALVGSKGKPPRARQNSFGLNPSYWFIQVKSVPSAIMTPIPAKETPMCMVIPSENRLRKILAANDNNTLAQ
jgi:hypothetical protein